MMNEVTWAILRSLLEIYGCMLLAPEVGYRLGGWLKRTEHTDRNQLSTIQGAILGLLGLMLGFSFAAAGSKFIDRQDLIVTEANAIGTAYLRGDLMEEPYRSQYQTALKEYTATRIKIFDSLGYEGLSVAETESANLHGKMWDLAVAGVKQSPEFDETVLPPLNEVIDLHTTVTVKMRRHLPWPVTLLLKIIAGAALFTVGFGNAISERRNVVLTTSLAFLVASVLWVTLDLDYPRMGLLQINDRPMVELYESLR